AGQLLELHEHQIPDLDEAVAFGIRRAGRTAGNVRPVVVEDFRARTAGPEIAHLPEIVGAGDADDLAVGQPGDLLPLSDGDVVIDVDGDYQAVGWQDEFLGDQIPGELDGAILEIIAKGEVAEHLEEGVVARGVAHVVEVVVFAAGAHAFLRGCGAHIGTLLETGEDVLELHHAGIGEHQGRVVDRHERRRRHDLVVVPGEVVEKLRPDLVDAAHARPSIAAASHAAAPSPSRRARTARDSAAFSGGSAPCPENPAAGPTAFGAAVSIDYIGALP